MLISIKNRSTGIFAWVIVLLIVIPFALFGIQSYFQQGENITVASVNGNEIYKAEFDSVLEQRTQQLSSQLGDNFNPELLEAYGFKRQVLDEMINRQLFEDYIKNQNFQIGDSQVAQNIRSQFTINGEFSEEAYQRYLTSTRQSPRAFENAQRRQLILQQLTQGLRSSAFVTPKQVDQIYTVQAQTRNIDYIELSPQDFTDQVEVTDAEIKEYYEENKQAFENAEEVQVSYVELSLENLSANYTPTDEEVQAAYEQIAAEQGEPDTRRASHILIETNDARDIVAARQQATDILEQINNGEDFAKLAEEFSDDAGSARNGGDLGVINRGVMVEPFEEAVFALNETGQVSDLVETEFGVHIIKLTEFKEGSKPQFDEVREQAEDLASEILAQSELDDLRTQLDTMLFDQPEDLKAIADEMKLDMKESVWFTRDAATDAQNAKIAQFETVREAAFDSNVIDAGLVSSIIEIATDRYVALQIKERKEAFVPPLEEVENQVTELLTEQKTNELIVSTGENYLQQLNEQQLTEESWTTWLSDNNLEASSFSGQRRELDQNLIMASETIFSMPKKEEQYTVQGEQLQDGRYLIIALKSVEQPDESDVSEEAQTLKSQIIQSLNQQSLTQSINSLTQSLRDQANIFVDEEQL